MLSEKDISAISKIETKELIGPLNKTEEKYDPKNLFLRGDVSLFEMGPRVSVVGTRNPSKEGIDNTINLTKELVKKKIVIVSGLARGIDTLAHQTAINSGGQTIAVLGTPLDRCYPHENRDLQEFICRHHLAVTQFSTMQMVQPQNFPIRNRVMALLSHATVIIEAGETSGTIHQGWEALRLGRPLFILNSLLENKNLKWPKKMMNYGAIPLLPKKVQNIFEVLPITGGRIETNAFPPT